MIQIEITYYLCFHSCCLHSLSTLMNTEDPPERSCTHIYLWRDLRARCGCWAPASTAKKLHNWRQFLFNFFLLIRAGRCCLLLPHFRRAEMRFFDNNRDGTYRYEFTNSFSHCFASFFRLLLVLLVSKRNYDI